MVKGDVEWPLCVSEEGVTNEPGNGAIECVSDPEGWKERLGEGVGSSNPGISAFQGVEVVYVCGDDEVFVCVKYVACPRDHL